MDLASAGPLEVKFIITLRRSTPVIEYRRFELGPPGESKLPLSNRKYDIISSKIKDPERTERAKDFFVCGVRYNGVVGLRSWRIDTMGKQKRPVLEGEDDGEGHSWKVLKANGGAVDVYYGKGGHAKFQLKKADKKTAPTEELVLQRIAEHRDAKRKQQDDDEGGGGGKKAKGSRLAAEAAAVTSDAESSMSPSGSKDDRRVQTPVPHLSTPGRLDRDYDAERRSADERREHRRMAEGFGNIQKIVDEEMDEEGSHMCHILKLVAMAIFSQRGGSELGPSSPEEKLRLVADLVSSELQGMLKQHKAAPMGEQPGQGEELEMLVVIGR